MSVNFIRQPSTINGYRVFFYHHHHQGNIDLGQLSTRSDLTRLEISSLVSPGFFCLLVCSFLVFSTVHYGTFLQIKVQFTLHQATEFQKYSFFNLGARWGWVVNATPRPLYHRERPVTHCVGGWVGLSADLDGCGKSRLHQDSIPGPSSPCRYFVQKYFSATHKLNTVPTRHKITLKFS